MMRQLSFKRILVDGTILSVLLSIIIYGSLYVNPLMWISDYPPDIQAAVGDVDVPLAQRLVVGVLLFGIVVGVPLRSNARLRRQSGGELSFWAAFVNSALIFFFFAVWDLLILDWLIFVTIQPDFIVIPGTEGLAGYKDYWFHFEASFLGWAQWISILVGGLLLAGLSVVRLRGASSPEKESGPEYYIRRQARLLKEHGKMAAAGQQIVSARYGEAFADALLRESLAEFDGLIPVLPYIGGAQNPLTQNLIQSASALAFYRVMQRHGKNVEETGELLYRITEAWASRYPRFLCHLIGCYFMSSFGQRHSKKWSAVTQERCYPGDWVRVHVEGNGETFDWGADYVECGIVKFLHSQGADELAPYLCLVDYATFGALGIGFKRTQTLAEGGEKCDFRFQKGGETSSGWPPPWLETQRK
jgi:hypothetical protein